jgi:hypothetical protein
VGFTEPRFDAAGKKSRDGMLTVRHNGVLIHEAVKVPRPSSTLHRREEDPLARLGFQVKELIGGNDFNDRITRWLLDGSRSLASRRLRIPQRWTLT